VSFRLRPVYLFLVVFVALIASCSGLPPVFPGPAAVQPEPTVPPPAEPPPATPDPASAIIPEGTVPVAGTTAIGPSQVITESLPTARTAEAAVTGQVSYRSRIALAPDAVVEVALQDISRADAPATLIASQAIRTEGKQVPILFTLPYNPSDINPAMRYAVSARITEGGKLTWISTRIQPVLTRGAPSDDVEIEVNQVRN
jgi:uncharacterized lipoprotein YbaY